jgi:transcriptional regulator with XRE-family HTH domain
MGAQHHFGAKGGVTSGNNIERLREERGWKRPELARRMGTTPQQVERLEKGQRRLTSDWIDKAAGALEVEPAMIIVAGKDFPAQALQPLRPPAPPRAGDDDVVEITALDLSLSMGPGTLIEEFVESEPIKMSLNLVQSITRTPSDRLRLVRGIGDSMEPTLRSSDRVMVDINEKQLSRISGIYWINREGAHGIKRLRPAGKGKILVISDNEIEPNDEVPSDEIRIEGRVIWFAREL